jgi:hypothetical protein
MGFENFTFIKNFSNKEELYKLNQTLLKLIGEQSLTNNTDTKATIYFGVADTNVQVKHDLGRIPTGYIVTRANGATAIYDGTTTWDETYIYLKSAASGVTVNIIIY